MSQNWEEHLKENSRNAVRYWKGLKSHSDEGEQPKEQGTEDEATMTEIEAMLNEDADLEAALKASAIEAVSKGSVIPAAVNEEHEIQAAMEASRIEATPKQSKKIDAPSKSYVKGKQVPSFLLKSGFSIAGTDKNTKTAVKSKSKPTSDPSFLDLANSVPGPPFPSPVKSDGGSQNNSPVKGHFKKQEAVLSLARCGPERRKPITDIRGLENPVKYLCYINSVLTLLVNIDPFTGYLNRVHVSNEEPLEYDLLTLLDDFARAYWTTDALPDSDLEYPAAVIKDYIRNLPKEHRFGIEPFVPSGGEDAHEDAADYLIKILQICSAQLRHGHRIFGEGHGPTEAANFGAMIEPVFQKRQACAGTGTICANKKVRSSAKGVAGDLYCPVIEVGVEEDSYTLQNTIAKFMRYDTELYCSRCKQFPDYKDKLGRFWNTFVETPEILLIRVNRLEYLNGSLRKMAWPLQIPEWLDLSQYLDKKAVDAGNTARYQLSGVVSHSGNPGGGHYVSYVKHYEYDNEWVRINDSEVSWSSFGEAVRTPEALLRYNSSFFPYILAYTKVHGDIADADWAVESGGDSSEFPDRAENVTWTTLPSGSRKSAKKERLARRSA